VTPTALVTYPIGEPLTSPVDGMLQLYIPDGQFEMGMNSGNPDAGPIHPVRLDGYWIDSTEVTNAMFASFLNANGNQQEGGTEWLNPREALVQVFDNDGVWQVKAGYEDHPIVGVSWFGAKAYCEWTGRRLPSEAEWEYAARGTDGRRFPWGDDNLSCDKARFGGCGKGTVPVGSYSEGASPFGVLDMAGNVAEWVNDRYGDNYYQNSPVENPQGPLRGYYRVVRGGFWNSTYIQLRMMHRAWAGADTRDSSIGFRCAFSP
jgi:formylglycine-generating enzyme required for sulfatase activity